MPMGENISSMKTQISLQDGDAVVVIGSGAGGASLAARLAVAGIKVVCLEAGRAVEGIVNDADAMFARLSNFDRRIGSGDLNGDFPVWSGKNVGGTTLHWTASTPRLRAEELRPTRYFGELIDTHVIDWPLDYAQLSEYYDEAEQAMAVSGKHGRPDLPKSNHFRLFARGASNVGLSARRGNMAINSVPAQGRPACLQLGFCVSGCAIQAKWTAANGPLAQVQGLENFELREAAMALRIEHDSQGRVCEVQYQDAEGKIQTQRARAVCVAANAIDTPRLLLHSRSPRFPKGLANRSGQVGRNYLKHVFAIVTALMPKPVNFHRGTQNLGRVESFHHSDAARGFVGGFDFEQVAFDPATLGKLCRPGAWGREYARQLSKYDHFAALLITGEDPAQHGNTVRLHPSLKDQYGLPVPIIHYVDHPNSRKLRQFALQQAKALFDSLGAEAVFFGPPPPATHNMGTCRMSADPAQGVCDGHGRCHDIDNLFISDGSAFSSSGVGNPTLTIVSLALRQADYISAQIRAGKL